MEQNCENLRYLMACVLNGKVPDIEKVGRMDKEQLYEIAKAHSLVGLAAMALEEAGEKLTGQWLQAKEKAVRKCILMDIEYERVAAFFEEQGIWYMPLKGRVIQEFYPKKGMRQMADTDILFDKVYRERVREYFEKNGYSINVYDKGNHDVYLKSPVYNFEMHVELYGTSHNPVWEQYYSGIKEQLKNIEGKRYGYCFEDEDFYVYVLSHAYKHFSGSGTGIRTLADQYVYLKEKEMQLDWKYINRELEKLGIKEYEGKSRALCKKLFSEEAITELDRTEEEILRVYISSATYGTLRQKVTNDMKNIVKETGGKHIGWDYIRKRLFPKREILEYYCPLARKHKTFLLYAWMKRVVCALLHGRTEIMEELKCIDAAYLEVKHVDKN